MDNVLTDIVFETVRAILVAAIFIYVCIAGKNYGLQEQPGWKFIIVGFGLILFGSLIDITDNFPALDRYLVLGDTNYQAFLEKLVGFTLGFLLLAIGFWKWLPRVSLEQKEKEEIGGRERYFRELIENSLDIITVLDREGVIRFGSHSFERILGYKANELIGKNVLDFIHPEEIQSVKNAFSNVIQEPGSIRQQELRFLHKDGSWRSFEAIGKYQPDILSGMIVVNSRDITERNRIAEELRIFSMLIEIAPTVITVHDLNGNYRYANQAALDLHGYSRKEFLALTVHDLDVPEDSQLFAPRMQQLREIKCIEIEINHVRKDRSILPLQVFATLTEWGGEQVVLSIASDITERKRVDKSLIESEARYRSVVEDQTDLICRFLPDGTLTFVNEAYCRQFSKKSGELIGHNFLDLIPEPERGELRTMIDTLSSTDPVITREHPVLFPDGAKGFQQWTNRAIYDRSGSRILEIQAVGQDITERKRVEDERLQMERRLLHAQKLESIGMLTGGIAHEFNNSLMAIMGNLSMSLMSLPKTSPIHSYIEEAVKSSHRSADLVRQMLSYSGRSEYVLTDVDLNELVRENLAMLRTSVSNTVLLNLQLGAVLPPLKGDTGQIQQAIMNLIANASEAFDGRAGVVVLKTGVQECEKACLDRSCIEEKPLPGMFVFLEVSDTGSGIDAEILQKLFDPFFSTKFMGRGLGLSAVQGIVRRHKGALFVDSKDGKGTTIRVLFPVSQPGQTEQERDVMEFNI